MQILKAKYTQDNSSLVVDIKKVHFQNSIKVKVRYELRNKFNGIVYEYKNTTLIKNQITSWRIHNGI